MDDKKFKELLLQREQLDYELSIVGKYDGPSVYTKSGDVFIPVSRNDAIDHLERKRKNIVKRINKSTEGRI